MMLSAPTIPLHVLMTLLSLLFAQCCGEFILIVVVSCHDKGNGNIFVNDRTVSSKFWYFLIIVNN